MLDLIMLGWRWLALAAALGAATGFVASSREKGAAVAPGWVFLALVVALLAGTAASVGGAFDGRMALTADIVLAVSAAYVLALPVGRGCKLLDAAQHRASRPESEAPAVAEPLAVEASALSMDAEPASSALVLEPAAPTRSPALDATVVGAKALGQKALEMRVRDKAAKKPVGQRPSSLAAPKGAADDLTRIKGLGPKSAERLNALGIFHYDQIAGWSRENALWVGAEIGVAGRVERDRWIAQACDLGGVSENESAASAA